MLRATSSREQPPKEYVESRIGKETKEKIPVQRGDSYDHVDVFVNRGSA